MTPVEIAANLRRESGANFTEELESFLVNGVVLSTGDGFVMARPCPKGVFIHDAWETWPIEYCDALYIWIAVGEGWRLIDLMPNLPPWLGWTRQGRGWTEISWLPTSLVRRRLHGFQSALDLHSKS
jgi:hypothetical protein